MTQFLRDLSTFSKKEIDNFLGSFDTILVDGDGVLWFLEEPLTKSIETINKLKQLGKKVFLVSNNCTITLDEYVEKVDILNLNVNKDEIVIPYVLVAEYLREQKLEKNAFVLASPAFKKELELFGIKCSEVGPDFITEDTRSFRDELEKMDRNIGAVVIDFDFNTNYIKLTKALMLLSNPNCLFVGGASDYEIIIPGGRSLIGPGFFISALEQISRRKAKVFGKPSPLIKDYISKKYPINCERTLVIGDTLQSDMKLGTDCGFLKLLVLSGISQLEDTKNDSTNLPHYYIQTLGDLLPLLPSS